MYKYIFRILYNINNINYYFIYLKKNFMNIHLIEFKKKYIIEI